MKKYDGFLTNIVTQMSERNRADAAMSEADADGTMHLNAEALQAMLDSSVKWDKLNEKEFNEIHNRIQDRYNRCSCSELIIVEDSDSDKNSEICPHCYQKQLDERRKRGKKKKI